MSITILLQVASSCLPMGFVHRYLTFLQAHVAKSKHIVMGDSSAGPVASKIAKLLSRLWRSPDLSRLRIRRFDISIAR